MSKRKQKEGPLPEPLENGLKDLPPVEELLKQLKAANALRKKREADAKRDSHKTLPRDLFFGSKAA